MRRRSIGAFPQLVEHDLGLIKLNKYNDTTREPSIVVVKGEWGWFRLRVFILEKIVAVAGVLLATGAFSN